MFLGGLNCTFYHGKHIIPSSIRCCRVVINHAFKAWIILLGNKVLRDHLLSPLLFSRDIRRFSGTWFNALDSWICGNGQKHCQGQSWTDGLDKRDQLGEGIYIWREPLLLWSLWVTCKDISVNAGRVRDGIECIWKMSQLNCGVGLPQEVEWKVRVSGRKRRSGMPEVPNDWVNTSFLEPSWTTLQVSRSERP